MQKDHGLVENLFGRVGVEHLGAVLQITLDRPEKLNAVSRQMARELDKVVAEINANDAIRCVVITGAGSRAFCAGTDVKQLDEFDDAWNFRNREDYCKSIRQIAKPVIAAINGYALGGGLEMALSCDIRLAAATAQFGAPEIKLGWIGGGGMAQMLSRAAGPSNASFMLMTGDPISAEQALQWGLVTEVCDPDMLVPRAIAVAEVIASRAPIAAEMAKLNIDAAANMPARQATQYELDLQAICFSSQDAAEGRSAFKQKRAPVFRRK